jgi:hypothetical protein
MNELVKLDRPVRGTSAYAEAGRAFTFPDFQTEVTARANAQSCSTCASYTDWTDCVLLSYALTPKGSHQARRTHHH